MITHTLAGWRDAVSTRLITNEDDTRGPLFWDTSVLGSSDRMHDLRPILFSRLWADRGGIRLIFLGTGTYLINAGVLSEKNSGLFRAFGQWRVMRNGDRKKCGEEGEFLSRSPLCSPYLLSWRPGTSDMKITVPSPVGAPFSLHHWACQVPVRRLLRLSRSMRFCEVAKHTRWDYVTRNS